jgi:hypothetical protein
MRERLQITYAPDAQHGWIPASWSSETFQDGVLVRAVYATVTEGNMNIRIDDDVFEDEYLPGTWVRNYIRDERYILREDGKRPVIDGEFDGSNYEQILHSDPLVARTGVRWPVVIILAVVICVIATAIWQLRARFT